MAPATFRPPTFELGDGAATFVAKEEHSSAIRWGHLPQLRAQAFVIRVILAAPFPRQLVHIFYRLIPIATAQQLLSLKLQIELHRLLQPPAPFPLAPPRSVAAADLEENHKPHERGDEQREEDQLGLRIGGEMVVEMRDYGGERGQYEREGLEEVGEAGDDQEGAGEEDEDEDEEVEGRGGGVAAEGGAVWGIRIVVMGGGGGGGGFGGGVFFDGGGRGHGGDGVVEMAHVSDKRGGGEKEFQVEKVGGEGAVRILAGCLGGGGGVRTLLE